MNSSETTRRGDVVIARLDPVKGSEQAGTRPVLIVSSDALNAALPVLTVAVLTSRKTDRIFPTEVLVAPPEGGLSEASKVLLYQVRTISKQRIAGRLGTLSQRTMKAVDEALLLALDLR